MERSGRACARRGDVASRALPAYKRTVADSHEPLSPQSEIDLCSVPLSLFMSSFCMLTATVSPSSRASKVAKRTSSATAGGSASKEVIELDEEMETETPTEHVNSETTTTKPTTIATSAPTAPSSSVVNPYHIVPKPTLTSGSYSYVDRSVVSEALVCGLCILPLVKPLQHKCGALFCQSCLQTKKDAGTPATCPDADCNATIRSKDLVNPAKAIVGLLESLVVKCVTCSETMTRAAYETHWTETCVQACPFATDGCDEKRPRATMNHHIDTCAYVPVTCAAHAFGCEWRGQRESQEAHHSVCRLHIALPTLVALQARHVEELSLQSREIAVLRESLAITNAQLKSFRDKEAAIAATPHHPPTPLTNGTPVAAGASSTTPLWRVGNVIDALDTEESWLIAKVLKVDPSTRQYLIHYVDWDSSWDEPIPFGSPRLAPGGTHTNAEHVAKHAGKVVQGGVDHLSQPIAPTTQDVLFADNKKQSPAATSGSKKRKAN